MTPQCTATAKSTGERCKRDAIKGGEVCHVHGGAAPQVQEKAQERLDRMADEVTSDVQTIVQDLVDEYENADDISTKMAIQGAVKSHWLPILDRTGHGPTEKREVDVDADVGLRVASDVVEVTEDDVE